MMNPLFLLLLLVQTAGLPDREPPPLPGVPGTVELKQNGGWCWYQGPRALVTSSGTVVFTSISGDGFGGSDPGDLWVTSWNPETNRVSHFELHDRFHRDDHDVAGLLERPDGRILAVYGKHGNDPLQRWRITLQPGDITAWSSERTFKVGAGYTYSNLAQLSAEDGRLYNFHRGRGWNPNCTMSDDGGRTWRYGWRLLTWEKGDLAGDPRYTRIDGGRPYLVYATNGIDEIHFTATDDHPRAYDNSLYHGFYRKGVLYDSAGKKVGVPGTGGTSPLRPRSFTEVFRGGKDRVAWSMDLRLDRDGRPVTLFSVQVNDAGNRGNRGAPDAGQDHRYHRARWTGKEWTVHQIARAGTRLYPKESDYTGLAALDPRDPDTVVISTNAHPGTGEPLVSTADGKRHWELYRGRTSDGGTTWSWTPITSNSTVDNLRPLVPHGTSRKRIILWTRGTLTSYTHYRLDVVGRREDRP